MEMYSWAFISLSVFLVPNLASKVTKRSFSNWNADSLNHTNCGEHGTYFDQRICLENGYHRTVPPDLAQTTVNISIHHIRVKEVNDDKRVLTFTIMLGAKWFDPRIKANFSEFEVFKEIEQSNVRNSIWTPTIGLRKMKNRKGFWDALEDRIFRISRNDEFGGNSIAVERTARGRVSVNCDPWNLETYPLDYQSCELTFYAFTTYSMSFIVSPLIDKKRTYKEDGFQISTTLIPGKHEDNFTIFLELERKLQPFFISGYLPSMAIVGLSGSSFLLPTNPLPARIGLGVTNFLTLTNLLIHETSHSPASDSLDLLTVYLVISLLFVMSTMLELTFIVFLKRSSEWKENLIKPTFTGIDISKNNGRYREITHYDYVDLISCSIYFILYLLFNCIYWGIYL